MKWPTVTFETLYKTPSRNGVTRPSRVRGEGYKMVNMGEIFAHDRIGIQEMERVQLNEKELAISTLLDGDLLFARQSLVLSGAGKCTLVLGIEEPTTFESHLIRVRLDSEKVNPTFYYYYFRSPFSPIRTIVQQCAQAGIRASDLGKLRVSTLPKRSQDRIAAILCAYDDLIENNRRRIKLLEESARHLYKEWFVRLRFPGHEHVKVVDGVLEGWERLTFDHVCDAVGGGTPSTAVPDYWDGDITWVTPSDVTSSSSLYLVDSEKKITESGLRNSSAKMLPRNAILMTSRASIGFFVLTDRQVCTNQGFISVIPLRPSSREFLLFHLMSRVDEFRSRASGSTFKELSKGKFRELNILWPPALLLEHFSEKVSAVLEQIKTLTVMNRKLQHARDLLLPRLMSGDITI